MKLNIRVSLNSDVGCIRSNNEDIILILGETYRDCSDDFVVSVNDKGRFVAALADGMGGHNAGEIASELAVKAFDSFIINLPENLSDHDFRNLVDNEIKKIHNQLINYGFSDPEASGLGTTLIAFVTCENRIYLINVGDSRIYRFRNGILCQLTRDHSEQNRQNDSSLPSNLIYNCLGGGGESAFADVMEITGKVYENDTFMLCSDGLSDMVSEEDMELTMNESFSARNLVKKAKSNGGKDNVSVLLLKINSID